MGFHFQPLKYLEVSEMKCLALVKGEVADLAVEAVVLKMQLLRLSQMKWVYEVVWLEVLRE